MYYIFVDSPLISNPSIPSPHPRAAHAHYGVGWRDSPHKETVPPNKGLCPPKFFLAPLPLSNHVSPCQIFPHALSTILYLLFIILTNWNKSHHVVD